MLTFYYHPLSPIARRVWLALLEKHIEFDPIVVNLKDGEQQQPDFLALNPFHHVPVLVDGDVRLIESLAILDYLEGAYPTPSLLPATVTEQAKMRMVQMVTVNELMPKTGALVNAVHQPLSPDIAAQLGTVLTFLQQELGDRPYFGGNTLNLADIVVGATVPLLTRVGLDLSTHPELNRWCQTIMTRKAWVETSPSDAALGLWQRWLQRQMQARLSK